MERLRNLAREALTWEHLSDHQRLVWAAALEMDVVPVQETTVWKDGGSLECRVNFVVCVVLQELPPWFFERLNITRRARGTGAVNGSMSDPKDVLEESMNAYCDYACTMELRESRLQLSCSGMNPQNGSGSAPLSHTAGVDLLSLDGLRAVRCLDSVAFPEVRRFLRVAKWVYKVG